MRRGKHVAHLGDMRNSYKILLVKPEGKRKFVRPSRRRKSIIKTDFKEIGFEGVGGILLVYESVQLRAFFLNTELNLLIH
jgi:hypothetical protein